MFIDEVYALGDRKGRDSFAKECIDTLNQNLSENKNNFICMVAGYEKDIEECFFSMNQGLRRRFTTKYTIEKYNAEELRDIFLKQVGEAKWQIDLENAKEIKDGSFFKDNVDAFPYFGGDIETFLLKCKMFHSERVFLLEKDKKMILTSEDIKGGFGLYKMSKGVDKGRMMSESIQYMYV